MSLTHDCCLPCLDFFFVVVVPVYIKWNFCLRRFFKSLHNVRKKHCVVSKRSSEAGLGRITQLDMALTQFGFIGFSLLCPEQLGIKATEEDFEGLVHLWHVIGYLLGMDDR